MFIIWEHKQQKGRDSAMALEAAAKVIIGGEVILDLTGDDVTAADVASGKKFHTRDGQQATGTNTYDANTSDATATAAEILATKTAYKNGERLTGTMPNRGAQTGAISEKTGTVTILQGYHDGSGTVGISEAEQAKIIAANIRQGVTILGIEGAMTGTEDMNAQAKSVTPSLQAQTILPDTGYNAISQVNVAAIPIVVTDSATGGKIYNIG